MNALVVSLGAMGVMSTLTIQCVDAFNVLRITKRQRMLS